MIYLRKTIFEQMMFIPKRERSTFGSLSFKAWSSVNQSGFSFIADDEDTSLLYYKVVVELPENVASGEYEYTLSDEVGVLSTGLLVIGDLEFSSEYNKEIAYEQYTE